MLEWPLSGRDGELSQLTTWMTSGELSAAVVAGPAGVGKTRLARECLRLAEDLGLATEQVKGTRSGASIPFGAIAHLIPSVEARRAAHPLEWAELLRRCTKGIVQHANGRRLILLVDDAHHLDDASATLVYSLAARRGAFVLATMRSRDPAPDPVESLWKDGLAHRIDLGGLSTETVEALLAKVLDGPVDTTAAVHLAIHTQGNVLYLRELVMGALEDGTLRQESGIWRQVGPMAPSDRLAELVKSRLGALTGGEAAVLELLSYAEPLGPLELSTARGIDAIEALERKALVQSRINGRRLEVRLGHPLYGDVLRSGIPAIRQQEQARSLAEAVEATGGRRREDTLRVATWRLTAGQGQADVLLAGARSARWHYDFLLAEQLARAAVDAGGGFDAELLAAQAAALSGRPADHDGELSGLAQRAVTDDERCRIAHARLDLTVGSGNLERAREVAVAAASTINDPAARDEIAARATWTDLMVEGPRAGALAAEQVLARAGGRARVWAATVASYSLARMGRVDDALSIATQGHETYLSLPEPLDWYPSVLLLLQCEALLADGDIIQASAVGSAQHREAVDNRSPEAQAMFAWTLSRVDLQAGRPGAAFRHAQEAVALFRQLGRPLHERDSLVVLAAAQALRGHGQEAGLALAAADDLNVTPCAYRNAEILQARAWTAVASGDPRRASELLPEAADQAEQTGDLIGAISALHDLARLGGAREVAGRISDLSEGVESQMAQAQAEHVRALAGSDPAALEEISGTFERRGALLLAAEAAADAAVAWSEAGHRRAPALAFRAATLAESCEGATTPALHALEFRARLTAAERNVAMMAAAGRSNRQIAEALTVSVRTVESQLQRAYEKLGLSSREELGSLLTRREGTPR